MLNGDPEFELLPEVDQWRFIKFIMLEIQTKKPVPLERSYLSRKGFDLRKRSISLTLQMLHNFVEVCNAGVTQRREEKEKRREEKDARAPDFKKPTLEDLKALFREKGFPAEAEKFFDYYESNGWRVGKNPMKSWIHAAANWLRNGKSFGTVEKKPKADCDFCRGKGYIPQGGKCGCWK